MSVAKGMSNNHAERNIALQGFYEQLDVAQQSQNAQETSIKAKLYDIISDISLTEENRNCLKMPLLNALEDIQNAHLRIRSSILIGLYSFWEVALYNIISSQQSEVQCYDNTISSNNKTSKSKTGIYLDLIYGNNIPSTSILLNGAIREFRNYIVHGKLSSSKKESIKTLETSNPGLCIRTICGECVITSYSGLRKLLDIIVRELDNAEYTSKMKKSKK